MDERTARTGEHVVYGKAVSAAIPAVPTWKIRVRDRLECILKPWNHTGETPVPHGFGDAK